MSTRRRVRALGQRRPGQGGAGASRNVLAPHSRTDFRQQQNTTSFCWFSQYGSLNDSAFAFPHWFFPSLTYKKIHPNQLECCPRTRRCWPQGGLKFNRLLCVPQVVPGVEATAVLPLPLSVFLSRLPGARLSNLQRGGTQWVSSGFSA